MVKNHDSPFFLVASVNTTTPLLAQKSTNHQQAGREKGQYFFLMSLYSFMVVKDCRTKAVITCYLMGIL